MSSMQSIRDAMQSKGYGVAHVAYKAGIKAEALEKCLDGQRQMQLDEFIAVCGVLGMTPKSFNIHPDSPDWTAASDYPHSMEYVWYYIEETEAIPTKKRSTLWACVKRDRMLYAMLIPMFIIFITYYYAPMFGLVIAFKDYKPLKGFIDSAWVGLKHFRSFFGSLDAFKIIRNTVLLNVYGLIFSFPCPVIFALLLNELRISGVKRFVQTVSYLPHFLSTVIVVGIVQSFLSPMFGLTGQLFRAFGQTPIDFMAKPQYFRTIYIASGVWQGMGWGSIIYLSAISGIDPALYEAAVVDGAGRMRQMLHITIPCISSVIIIMLIMSLGNILNVGFEKVLLLQNAFNYETSNVISTYVYQRGLVKMSYSFGTAVGLFNSVVGMIFVVSANCVSKRVTEVGLW